MAAEQRYYLPNPSHWPITGSIGLFLLLGGFASYLSGMASGPVFMIIGFAVVVFMMFGWFGIVIGESEKSRYNDQVDVSFRMGMGWFIFSEILFFAAFFGALFYARVYSVPWMGGEGVGALATHPVLWPDYEAAWPTNGPADIGEAFEIIPAFGIPALNTIILLTSGVTVTLAHWALKKNQRARLSSWLFATVALGVLFLYYQVVEFHHAYTDLNLTLGSGIYGSTFFMLTGFHGLHVTMGVTMLTVIWVRTLKGHFTPERHFAFEGVAWYWHFVDVVWLGLFIFVYWL